MAVLADDQIIYSADSHVVEPADLWIDYIEPEFRERAPHLEHGITRDDGTQMEGEFLVCDGIAPQRVATFAAADVDDPRKRAEAGQRGYEQIRRGGWDPKARIEDQDLDGVAFEVLYPSMAMPMFSIADTAYQQAVFRAYNAWVADFSKAAPDRLAGIALISLDDIDAGVKEMTRARELGLKGAMIWNDPGEGRTYADAEFDPVWAAAADLDMPISLHILTGKEGTGLGTGKPFLADYMALPHAVQISLTAMLSSGVFARHRNLKVVSVENDIGWLGHFLYRLEHAFEEFRYLIGYDAPLSPMEYFHQQCFATFQDDPVGIQLAARIGEDRLMWASDYPHGDSTWPESRATIEHNFEGASPELVRKVTRDNVAGLYGIT